MTDKTDIEAARVKLERELGDIRKSNQEKYRALLSKKQIPAGNQILMARIEALLDVLFAHDTDMRLAFDVTFERRMTAVLNECLAEMRERQISDLRLDNAAGNGLRIDNNGLILP